MCSSVCSFKMKNFLVLLFYLMGPNTPAYGFLENVPPHPWFFMTQMQRLQPKHLTILPRPTHPQAISKFIYWKHLLELECFKEICGQINFKDRSGYKRPVEMIGHRQMPAFRNDGAGLRDRIPSFYKTGENQVRSELQIRRKYPGNERIILWPPERNFTEKQAHVSPTKQEFGRSQTPESAGEKLKGNPKESTPLKDFIQQRTDSKKLPPNFLDRTTEPKDTFENSGAFPEEDSPRRISPDLDTFPELFQKPGVMRSSTDTYPEDMPYGFRHRVSPSRIQPYEVEEIIEEKFLVDVDDDDDKDEDSFKPFVGRKVSGKDILKNEMAKAEEKKKTEHFQSVIDSSVNTILKGLISPVIKTAPSPGKDVSEAVLPLEKPEKQPMGSGVKISTAPEAFRTFTSYPFSEKPNEIIFGTPWNRQQTYTKLKKIQPIEGHYGWRQQTAEAAQKVAKKLFKPDTRVDNSRGFDLNSSFEKEYLKSFLLTESPKRLAVTEAYDQSSINIFNTDEFQSDLAADLGRNSMSVPQKIPELSRGETLESLDLLRNFMAIHQPDFTPTEEVPTTTQKISENSENPSTRSLLSSETPDFVSESVRELLPTTESITTGLRDSGAIFNGEDTALTTGDFLETVQYISETEMDDVSETEHTFLEFSDHPISFDLLTTTIKFDSEKDQETIRKSSRRMHLGHEPPRTTVSNGISYTGEAEQRRSDILITDNLADYVDDENNLSALSYFEKLKQNNSLLPSDPHNLTADALIPLIPVVINDLREGRIPPEDMPMLSRALGKYWNPVLALSNFTSLDMLPLIKMKDEKDLENVLQNFLPEDQSSTTVGTTESDSGVHDDYGQSYDYMDEYKDLYKDILGQELGDKRRRFRPRRDAEDDLKTLEATREYFDSIEEDRSDEGSDYIFEDIMYDEVSDDEDASVFELIEVSDVHIEKDT